ncbi:hypothetical protein MRX96_017468 [Rhipicephalus microplus]
MVSPGSLVYHEDRPRYEQQSLCYEKENPDEAFRNWSLVTRAAHFDTGTRHRYCASSLELVHWSPAVVAKVQELASIDENKAVSRIQSSLKSFSELGDFMRMAGVVKWGGTCNTRDDCRLEPTDLNRDCWLHKREYLTVGDILDVS